MDFIARSGVEWDQNCYNLFSVLLYLDIQTHLSSALFALFFQKRVSQMLFWRLNAFYLRIVFENLEVFFQIKVGMLIGQKGQNVLNIMDSFR